MEFSSTRDLSSHHVLNQTSPVFPDHHLRRQALLNRLIENPQNRKIVLVQAPAGFGKTSLLLQYYEWSKTQNHCNFWLTVDSTINDLNRFVQIFNNVINQDQIVQNAREYKGIIDTLAHYGRPFKIFFDDFENIQNPAVLQFIEQILINLPDDGEIIIGSRNIPKLNLGKIRIHRQLLDINHDDLRLNYDEVEHIFQQIYHVQLKPEDINLVLNRSDGWPAAITLIALALPKQNNVKDFLSSFSGKNAELAEFIVEEILNKLDDAERNFILKTSVLHELDADVCNWICNRQDSQSKLEELYKRNFFLISLNSEKNIFKYHGLFNSFLNNYIRSTNSFDINELHQKAAEWYISHNRPIKAIDHLIENQDQGPAIQLISQHAKEQLSNGRIRRLLKWFEKLRPEFKRQIEGTNLHLIYAWALALNRHPQLAEQEIKKFLSVGEENISLEAIQEAKTVYCLVLSMTDQIVECHRLTTELLRDLSPHLYLEHGVLSSIVAFCMISTNQYDAARQLMSHAMMNNGQLRLSFVRTLSDSHDGMIDIIQGRLGHALSSLENSYEKIWATSSQSLPGGKANIGVPYAEVLYEIGEIEKAKRILADTLAYTRENGTTDVIITAYTLQARIFLYEKDAGSAYRSLKELETLALDYGLERAICSAKIEKARLLCLEGDFYTAKQLQQTINHYHFWETTQDYHLPSLDLDDAEMLKC